MSTNDVVTTNDIIQLYNYHLLLACNNNLVVQKFGRFDRYHQSVNIVFYPIVQPTNGLSTNVFLGSSPHSSYCIATSHASISGRGTVESYEVISIVKLNVF